MTNFEYYKDKILEIARNGHSLAMSKTYKTLRTCEGFDCDDCCFNDDSIGKCDANLIKWLYEEHKEWPTLTRFQHDFLEKMAGKYKWMARDSYTYTEFWFYENKPTKRTMSGCAWEMPNGMRYRLDTALDVFNFVKWEDEPWNIRELLENCEVRD